MSLVRISEFSNRPPNQAGGEWYAIEGRDSSIRLERGELEPEAVYTEAGHLLTSWTGSRIASWGSGTRGPLVYLLKYPVPLDYWYEFDAWFQYEHMPMLLEEPTWYGCEFFRALGASSYPFAALHYVEPQALKSDARNRSIDTPWWHRLKQHEWFDKQFIRTLMRPL
jgi:hypothetical protein